MQKIDSFRLKIVFFCANIIWKELLEEGEKVEISQKALQRGRAMYVLEAAFEYLISILVAGSFLATLTTSLGFSDSLTGVLSSVISLGCLFELISFTIRKTRVKGFIIALSLTNQLLFMLLYVVPVTNFTRQTKIAVFVALIFSAYILYNFAHPKKINWLMSLVEDKHRGRFTAGKEIVSLISGMLFTFFMGSLIDDFKERGELRVAFILSAAVIFILMVLHTVSMFLTPEREVPEDKKISILQSIREVFRDKNVLKVTLVFVLYHIGNHVSHPFMGTYQINELGFSLQFVSLLSILSSVVQIAASVFLGRYADKNSFAKMIEKCFIALVLANVCIAFAIPSNGKVMFALHYALHGFAMGGISSALINLIFDYVPSEKRADSLAVSQAAAGLAGFLTTLAVSPLVSHIQARGNTFLGFNLYAQQVVSIISVILILAVIVYVRKVLIKGNKN